MIFSKKYKNKITVSFVFNAINGIGSWVWISPDQKHDAAVLMVGPQHSLVTNYATPTVNRNLIRSSDGRQLFCISVLLSSLPPIISSYICFQNTSNQLKGQLDLYHSMIFWVSIKSTIYSTFETKTSSLCNASIKILKFLVQLNVRITKIRTQAWSWW